MSRLRPALLCALPLGLLFACGGVDPGDTEGETDGAALGCVDLAPDALRTCVADYGAAIAACYDATDAACSADDADLAAALDALQGAVEGACSGDEFGLEVDATVGRLRNACASEASSLAWRSYGGPQGAVWPDAGANAQECIAMTHATGAGLIDDSLMAMNDCLADGECDGAAVSDARATLEADAVSEIEAACSDLGALIAVDPTIYVDRAARQADCIASAGHMDTGDLELRCGHGNAQFDAPRGEWKQIVVDGDEWGTLCGDGTPYAFHVRLAPEGEPLDRVLIGLQGGGVCLFEDDCNARMQSDPGLFNAMDDDPFGFGIGSTDPAESPFGNWTIVYMPYCNQDVFAGGGVDENLGSLTLPRYGAVNIRAASQMVRDVLWREMDAAGGAGFRPDELKALVGGWSAGGYGTLYNYHWYIDDLQWPRTAAFPDAGLGLDNGSLLGVGGLGDIKIPTWGTLKNLPPYCFAGSCAVGETLLNAISPRLKSVPEQQMLMLTNPYDLTQQGDAFFDDTPSFINELRRSYCATKDLPGVQYYMTSESSQSIHVISIRPNLWEGAVDGEVMRDWFDRAMNDPDTLEDRVEEADFVTAFPGVDPFPCEVAP